MFSTLPKTYCNFRIAFILLSANALILDYSKIVSHGKELRFSIQLNFILPKLKAFVESKLLVNMAHLMEFVFEKTKYGGKRRKFWLSFELRTLYLADIDLDN